MKSGVPRRSHTRDSNLSRQACINQSDIEANLACLPIFLAGCKELLIIAGPTYTTRLWACAGECTQASHALRLSLRPLTGDSLSMRWKQCIIEVFSFLKMGGSKERISLLPISDTLTSALPGQPQFALQTEAMWRRFASFDVQQAQTLIGPHPFLAFSLSLSLSSLSFF